MKYFITGTRRGLGYALKQKYGCCENLESCDVFINCKHDDFEQVRQLYVASQYDIKIINIGSNSPDQSKDKPHPYQVQKAALDIANNLFKSNSIIFCHCYVFRNVYLNFNFN